MYFFVSRLRSILTCKRKFRVLLSCFLELRNYICASFRENDLSKLNRGKTSLSFYHDTPFGYRDVLHRKEVIQPQVLLRLPCYDFTPIADPTLGRFLSCELDHALWVLPTLMV